MAMMGAFKVDIGQYFTASLIKKIIAIFSISWKRGFDDFYNLYINSDRLKSKASVGLSLSHYGFGPID